MLDINGADMLGVYPEDRIFQDSRKVDDSTEQSHGTVATPP